MSRTAVLLLIVGLVAEAQQNPNFRADVNLVNVTCSVRSVTGEFVSQLDQNDFEVLEDGVPQKVKFFARHTDLPLSVGLIIDASGSQNKFVQRHAKDLEAFLIDTLHASDQAFALCFGNHLRLVSDFTSSPSTILNGLSRFQHSSRGMPELGPVEERDLGTALYDAIYFSIAEKMASPEQRRRALIVLSDGEENSSEHDLLDTIRGAQNADTLIFGIRYTQLEHNRLNARNKYGIRVMDHLAQETGGTTFDALHTDLHTAFEQIGAQLRSMYELAYASTNPSHDGSYHKVTIRVKNPDLIVRAKSGYFAVSQAN